MHQKTALLVEINLPVPAASEALVVVVVVDVMAEAEVVAIQVVELAAGAAEVLTAEQINQTRRQFVLATVKFK
jgi:hypothetical protein